MNLVSEKAPTLAVTSATSVASKSAIVAVNVTSHFPFSSVFYDQYFF